jgi:hypothetical protein
MPSVAAHLSLVGGRPTSTGSIALLTTAVDALFDVGEPRHLFRRALRGSAADREHRFGHEKGEAVAAFTQAMFLAGAQPGRREWAVKPISRSQMEWRVGLDSGRSRGDFCRRANRPTEASKAAVCYVRNTSTPIKRRAGVRFLPLEAASCTASIRTGALDAAGSDPARQDRAGSGATRRSARRIRPRIDRAIWSLFQPDRKIRGRPLRRRRAEPEESNGGQGSIAIEKARATSMLHALAGEK